MSEILSYIQKFKHFFSKMKESDGKYFYLCLLMVVIIPYSFYYVDRFINDVAGWNVFSTYLSLNENKMVYRDFFYVVTPGYFLELKFLVWIFDGSFLAIRIFAIIRKIFLFGILYSILQKWFKSKIVWIACVIGFFEVSTASYDSFGDYTAATVWFIVIAIYFGVKYFQCLEKSNYGLKSYIWLAATGLALSFSFLFKQSHGIVVLLAFGGTLLLVFVALKVKEWWKYLLVAALSWLIPVIILAIWLAINNALLPCIEQVFLAGANSKGVSSGGIPSLIIGLFTSHYFLIFCFCSIAFFLVYILWNNEERYSKEKKWKLGWIIIILLNFAIYISIRNKLDFFNTVWTNPISSGFYIQILVGILIFLFLAIKIRNEIKKGNDYYLSIIIAMFIMLSYIIITTIGIEKLLLLSKDSGFSITNKTIYFFSFYTCVIFYIYEIYNLFRYKKTHFPLGLTVVFTGAIAISFGNLLSVGTPSFSSSMTYVAVPVMICVLLSIKVFERSGYIIIVTFSLILGINTMIMKFENPYSWWGWDSEPITDETNYTIDFEMLKGFKVSKKTKVTLEEVTKLIELNSEENDYVLSFPYSVMYNMLAERYNIPTFAQVYFFDVCPDDVANSDLEIMKNNLPKIIVWKDMGENCWATHERIYRGGNRLGQRDIQDWYNQVINNQYSLIGKVYNLSVYKLNDGSPTNYTYFENENSFTTNIGEYVNNDMKISILRSGLSVIGLGSALYQKIVVLFLLIIGILAIIKFRRIWMILLLILSMVGICLNISPLYYLIFSIPLICMVFEEKKCKKYVVFNILLMIASIISCILYWVTNYIVLKILLVLLVMMCFFSVFLNVREWQNRRN